MSFTFPGLLSQPTPPAAVVGVLGTASSPAASRRGIRAWHLAVATVGATALAASLAAASVSSAPRPTTRALTVDEVRGAFIDAGEVVDQPTRAPDGVILLSVRDPAQATSGQPRLRVFVYASTEADQVEHQHAHAREESSGGRAVADGVDGVDAGPQLLTGYGPSAWRANVALAQAAPVADVGAYPIEPDCADVDAQPGLLPSTRVDAQYVTVLDPLLRDQ
jgi:hypothetical protein